MLVETLENLDTMFGKKKQVQKAGDNSVNNQAGTINYFGISYSEAKDIAIGVFKENFLIMSQTARAVAEERAEYITNEFLTKIQEKNPLLLNSMAEPSMLYALYSAQKEYAKSGETDTADILVNVLLARAEINQRNLKQIVLDESISVIPKLTNTQLNVLSLVFLIKMTTYSKVRTFQSLQTNLHKVYKPLCTDLPLDSSSYQHIEYTNCGSVSQAMIGNFESLEEGFARKYPSIFNYGFTVEELSSRFSANNIFRNEIDWKNKIYLLLTPSLNSPSKLKLFSNNEQEIRDRMLQLNFNDAETALILFAMNNFTMSSEDVKSYILTEAPFLEELFEVYNDSLMQTIELTSVGIAIALTNINVKTGSAMDLSNWIK